MAAFSDRLIPPKGALLAEALLVHDVPGRLRLVAPLLKSKPDRAAVICAGLNQARAVRAVHFNALTGSIIVAYDAQAGNREAVLRALNRAGCRMTLRRSRALAPSGVAELPAVQAALRAVLHCVLHLAVESMVVAVL